MFRIFPILFRIKYGRIYHKLSICKSKEIMLLGDFTNNNGNGKVSIL